MRSSLMQGAESYRWCPPALRVSLETGSSVQSLCHKRQAALHCFSTQVPASRSYKKASHWLERLRGCVDKHSAGKDAHCVIPKIVQELFITACDTISACASSNQAPRATYTAARRKRRRYLHQRSTSSKHPILRLPSTLCRLSLPTNAQSLCQVRRPSAASNARDSA